MISYDKENNRWRVSVFLNNLGGKKKRIWKTAKTKKEAKQIEARLLLEQKGAEASGSATIDAVFDSFYDYSKENRRQSTADFYKRMYQKNVSPYIGQTRISSVSPSLLLAWKKETDKRSISLVSKNHIYVCLHALFRYCDRFNGTALASVLDKVGRFREDPNKIDVMDEEEKEEKERIHYWTMEQFQKVAKWFKEKAMAVKETSYNYMTAWSSYLFLETLFYSGARRSEANALLVQDFKEKDGKAWFSISKTVPKGHDGTEWKFAPTKNKASVRDIPIPECLAMEIKKHIEERIMRMPSGGKTSFLFGGAKPLPEATFDMMKNKAEKETGVPHIRVHDLRHSYATYLINNGVPLTVISRLLGHSSVNITWKVYASIMPKTMEDAISVFDK